MEQKEGGHWQLKSWSCRAMSSDDVGSSSGSVHHLWLDCKTSSVSTVRFIG